MHGLQRTLAARVDIRAASVSADIASARRSVGAGGERYKVANAAPATPLEETRTSALSD